MNKTKEQLHQIFTEYLDKLPKPQLHQEFHFKSWGKWDNCCDVLIWKHDNPIVLFLETPQNKGTSITNASEFLVKQVFDHFKLPINCRFFESYSTIVREDTQSHYFSEVYYEMSFNSHTKSLNFSRPNWRYVSLNEFRLILS